MRGKTQIKRTLLLALAVILGVTGQMTVQASAASQLSNTYIRLERMKTATAAGVRVVFKTSSATLTEDSIKVNFAYGGTTVWTSASGTVAASPGTPTTAACATDTGATAVPGTLTSAGASGVITVSGVTNLTASTSYCFDLPASSVTTPNAAGEYLALLTTQTGATIDDQASIALRIVADDQITVTANVPPTFNFALDSNTTAFTADLSPGTKRTTTARTFTVNTNAKTGWVAWLRNSDTNGLYSAGVTKNIAPTTPGTAVDVDAAASTEQYVWGATAVSQGTGAGTTTLATAYDATGSNEGSGVDNTYRQVASSNGTAATAVVTVAAAATISGVTPAASDYTDTIQVIGAGQF